MRREQVRWNGMQLEVCSLNTVVVGTGAAGFNAADRLYSLGQKDIAIITEGLNKGTSRNTGSDKQTYYKLTLAGEVADSVYEMAKTLYDGGCMDGDIALVEAALSAQSFYHLVDIGVHFPHNSFGEFVGYRTDHDPRQRATSIGPLTSKCMTEKLEEQVKVKGITIFDGYQVIGILTDSQKNKAIGLITLNLNEPEVEEKRYVLFNCTNIIYATGGPAGIYATSSYPKSQIGATGLAFEAGVWGKNLTESQYGIASIQFRWNLSGTYQQVLPRYVSTEQDGSDERELLEDYFKDPGTMLDAIFLKGYQWPFDPKKIHGFGSSLIDILVYNETVINSRRVWLDFMHNPNWGSKSGELDFALLGKESFQYLKNSNALFGTPIERLARMNQPAIDLYKEHNIDITKEYLEIAVCAQHNNGGLYGNYWWESNLEHFFPVGEVNGSHGVYRPGGSALNSGQVGSIRAAQYITARHQDSPQKTFVFLQTTERQIKEKIDLGQQFLGNARNKTNVMNIRREIGERMTRRGAHIRSLESACEGAEEAKKQLSELTKQTQLSSPEELGHAFQNYDLLITQFVYLSAIKDYIEKGGRSRGSYLIKDPKGTLPVTNISNEFRFTLDEGSLNQKIQKVYYRDGTCEFKWDQVKPIPRENSWFESVWNNYMQDNIIR
ncbi:MAG: FAD-binding protein [Candidatus Bathyarchaeota archaeon]|nr:FAD-binding protein [Candidatus Bathyarchaeota archaeon]